MLAERVMKSGYGEAILPKLAQKCYDSGMKLRRLHAPKIFCNRTELGITGNNRLMTMNKTDLTSQTATDRRLKLGKVGWGLAGLAAGVAAVSLLDKIGSKQGGTGSELAGQDLINWGMDKAFGEACSQNTVPLTGDSKYIIFSDHHKGARSKADDFLDSEQTYLDALNDYLDKGYTLIVLGDAEELWEEKPEAVLRSYKDVLEKEQRFYQEDRYIRIYGNHDITWKDPQAVESHLHSFFPGIEVRNGLVFSFTDDQEAEGKIFLVHGHQGTIDSDLITPFSRWAVRYFWRRFQIATGLGRTTPAKDACLRAAHDTMMYRWASEQDSLILIAGHTHRPIWSSRTHLEKALAELFRIRDEMEGDSALELNNEGRQKIVDNVNMIKNREGRYSPCTDTIKTRPAYFNTGCCSFQDGNITGIELTGDEIRLIKWSTCNKETTKEQLEETSLEEIFYVLSCF